MSDLTRDLDELPRGAAHLLAALAVRPASAECEAAPRQEGDPRNQHTDTCEDTMDHGRWDDVPPPVEAFGADTRAPRTPGNRYPQSPQLSEAQPNPDCGDCEDERPGQFEPVSPLAACEVPTFPVDALPSGIGAMVSELARALRVPADIPGALGLGVASAAAAWAEDRAAPRVRWGTMEAPLQLYAVAVAPSGSNKSAVRWEMCAPLATIFDAWRDAPESRMARAREAAARDDANGRVDALQSALRDARKLGRKWKGDPADELREQLADATVTRDALPFPSDPQLLASDATPEALAVLLAGNPAILVTTSEAQEIFDLVTGRYGKGARAEVLLKGWDGESFEINRKAEPRRVRVDRPAVSMAVAAQPVTIEALAKMPGDLNERGLTGRFLIAWPPPITGARLAPGEVSEADAARLAAARAEYTRTLRLLFNARAGAEPMRFDSEATAIADDFYRRTEARIGYGADLEACQSMVSKMHSHLARFAGILHLADGGDPGGRIGAETVARALRLAEYFLGMGIFAWGRMREPQEVADARKLWAVIQRWAQSQEGHGSPARGVTKRDLHQRAKGTFSLISDIEAPIEILKRHGFIAVISRATGRPGRPPSDLITVNPAAPVAW